MNAFVLEPMGTTTFGEGSVAGLAQHVRAHGDRAFVVSDAGVQAAGVLEKVTSALAEADLEWTSFVGVDPNPTDVNVAAGVAALNEFGLEGVVMVLVGGGSVMDCGKRPT